MIIKDAAKINRKTCLSNKCESICWWQLTPVFLTDYSLARQQATGGHISQILRPRPTCLDLDNYADSLSRINQSSTVLPDAIILPTTYFQHLPCAISSHPYSAIKALTPILPQRPLSNPTKAKSIPRHQLQNSSASQTYPPSSSCTPEPHCYNECNLPHTPK